MALWIMGFGGTVPVLGSSVTNFTVAISGNVTVTLTAAGPPPNITMGMFVGNPAATGSSTCLALTGGTTSGPARAITLNTWNDNTT